MQEEKQKIDLTGLEYCPTCGHKLKIKVTEAKKAANRENAKKGGRPIDPNSKRQIALRKKAERK